MKKVYLITCCLLMLVISGCIETKDEYFINPDGTGKVIHEAVLGQIDMGPNISAAEESPEIKAKRIVRDEVKNAEGVEVWKDISWEMLGDEKIRFKGTAYFQDISKVKFHNGGGKFNLLNEIRLNLKNGSAELLLKDENQPRGMSSGNKTDADETEDYEKTEKELRELRPMLSAFFAKLKIERIFHLPGTTISSSNFETLDKKTIRLLIEGEKVMELVDENIESGKFKDFQKNGYLENPQDTMERNEYMFGENADVKAVYQTTSGDLFDYAGEVNLARVKYPQMLATFNAIETKRIDPSMAGKFHIGGIRAVFESDSGNGVRPFGYDKGLTLSVIGHLPHKAVSAKDGEITKAVTSESENLLSDKEWDNKIHFPNISKDKQMVIFDINLKEPKTSGRTLKTLEGSIQYVTAGTPKKVDLQISNFIAGAKGAFYNAKIEKIGTSRWDSEKQEMDLKLELSIDKIKEIKLYDSENNPIKVSKGQTYSNDEVTFHLSPGKGQFPRTGRIEIIVYEKLEQFELPFKLENIKLPER